MSRWLVVAALLVGFQAAPARAVEVGLGVAAGASIALAQSDNGNGSTLALRVPVNPLPLLTVEPFLAWNAMGSAETSIGGTSYSRDGFEMYGFGAIAALGGVGMTPRFPFYPYLGMGGYSMKREGTPEETHPGYMLGVGYARPLPANLALNARTGYTWITLDGSARRFFELNVGVSIRLHPGPQEGM